MLAKIRHIERHASILNMLQNVVVLSLKQNQCVLLIYLRGKCLDFMFVIFCFSVLMAKLVLRVRQAFSEPESLRKS
jgi:hypothetical protein